MSQTDTLIVCRTRAHQRAQLRGRQGAALVWTIGDLWDRLGAWACLRQGLVRDELGARLLAASVLADAGEGGSAVLPRIAPALDALRRELVACGTSATTLLEALTDGNDHSEDDGTGRRADIMRLIRLLAAVEAGLRQRQVVDEVLARRHALDLLIAGQRPGALVGIETIELHLPIDLTPLDTDLIVALGRLVHVRAILPVDDASGRHAVVGADRIFQRLETAAGAATGTGTGGGIEVVTDGVVGDGPVAEFRRALFGTDVVTDAPVSVALAADVEEEARLVVGSVRQWQHHHPETQIVVAARRLDQLTATIRALERDGLAVRRRRRTLAESPGARLLLDLAALRTDGMPRDRLIAVLLNPARRDALHPNDAGRLLTTLRRAAARRDHEDTATPSGGYRRRLEQLQRRDAASADDVAFALRTIEPIMAAASTLPMRGRLSAHLDAWLALARRVVDDARALGGAEVFEIVARLVAGARRVGDPTASIELFAMARLVQDELERQPWLDDDVDVPDLAIEVMTLPELAGRDVDVVIVIGAVEGELPQPPRQRDSLISDVDRVFLNGVLGRWALATADRATSTGVEGLDGGLEGLWWLLGLRAAKQRLILLAPRREARGRDLAPSAFLLDAARALGVTPQVLQASPAVGVPLPVAADRRQRTIRRAKNALAAGATNDAAAMQLARATTMALDRKQWFQHVDRPFEERRGPFAFAVDDKRVARAFGHAFGLQVQRPLTPTRLESLAECRLHGFVQHVLKLDVDVEPGNAIEARVAGTFAHTVLERFYTDRARHGVGVTRFLPADRVRLTSIIDEETTRALHTASGHVPALRAALRFMKSTLTRVVATVSAHPPVEGVEPVAFELQIGVKTGGREADLPAAPIDIGDGRRIFIGGIIDRVDEGPDARAVVDYKTMSAARVKEKAAPRTLFESHFQLLVYLRLMENARPTQPDTALHGYLLSLKDGVTSADVAATHDLRDRVMSDARDDSLGTAIGRVILPILTGTLPPDAGARCAACRLQRVCRIPLEGAFDLDPDDVDDEFSGTSGGAS